MTADSPPRQFSKLSQVDRLTRDWIRNRSDELAALSGCRFDPERGQFTIDWIQDFCTLYEGELAGEKMRLEDWQNDCTMRMFSWIVWNKKWNRWIRRFREADIYIPKKNGKSPTLAAWGLYLLCGDGEKGQKVYLAAKDGTQARDIAGKHAMAMVEMSGLLSDPDNADSYCHTNKNEASIEHRRTRSVMKPLSSSSERTQKSKEGLNGCVLIDETHVVDEAFVNIISRAHLSRSEPFFIKVSTAGNNPDSYGKKRFDYAKLVEAGKVEDQGLFVAIFAAPQDITDAEIDRDPIKYGKMANPTWGRLIDPEEYLEDYRKSRKNGLGDFVTFKMYRLNIWQRAANPWLRMSDWMSGKVDFTLEHLRGRRCWAGLDLSKTRDMSALALCFPGDDEGTYYLLTYFFMPEETAREYAKVAPFVQWGEQGLITLTHGGVTDYGFIRQTVRKLCEVVHIDGLFYDATYAEQLTQQLADGEYGADDEVLVEGLGLERIEFPQRMRELAPASADFERHVLEHSLWHTGHPVMDWQIGHVSVWMDANGNKRPIKPKNKDDYRKIDGVVASIMALAGAMGAAGEERSVYNTRRLLVLDSSPKTRPGPAEADAGEEDARQDRGQPEGELIPRDDPVEGEPARPRAPEADPADEEGGGDEDRRDSRWERWTGFVFDAADEDEDGWPAWR